MHVGAGTIGLMVAALGIAPMTSPASPSSMGTTVRVSGLPRTPGASTYGAVSADGTVVAFHSTASFDAADTNDTFDVFVRDLTTGIVERLSTGAAGGRAVNPSISADGALVAYAERGPGPGLIVVDRRTGERTLVVSGKDASSTAMSSDGRWVTVSLGLRSVAVDLMSGASAMRLGTGEVSISRTGTMVYVSPFRQLPDDTDDVWDAYALDVRTGTHRLLTGDVDDYILGAVISDDGGHVALERAPSSIGDVVHLHAVHLDLLDLGTGTTSRVTDAAEPYDQPAVSSDGAVVVFGSPGIIAGGANPVGSDPVPLSGIYVWERATNRTSLASVRTFGAPGIPAPQSFGTQASNPRVSPDGRFVVFDTAQSLDADDVDIDQDVYLHDRRPAL